MSHPARVDAPLRGSARETLRGRSRRRGPADDPGQRDVRLDVVAHVRFARATRLLGGDRARPAIAQRSTGLTASRTRTATRSRSSDRARRSAHRCASRATRTSSRSFALSTPIGDPEVALHGFDVRAKIVSRRGDVAAQVVYEIEQRDVEVLLPLGVGLGGAAEEPPHDAQQPFVTRGLRTVTPVGEPDLAPAIRTGGSASTKCSSAIENEGRQARRPSHCSGLTLPDASAAGVSSSFSTP